ncbi:MAG: hypothetical protein HN403_05915 [Rhodospirillales bacterium]|jgi:hypothetical protein|nr:hypothetical protein [Rhodospirillales bacterium]
MQKWQRFVVHQSVASAMLAALAVFMCWPSSVTASEYSSNITSMPEASCDAASNGRRVCANMADALGELVIRFADGQCPKPRAAVQLAAPGSAEARWHLNCKGTDYLLRVQDLDSVSVSPIDVARDSPPPAGGGPSPAPAARPSPPNAPAVSLAPPVPTVTRPPVSAAPPPANRPQINPAQSSPQPQDQGGWKPVTW